MTRPLLRGWGNCDTDRAPGVLNHFRVEYKRQALLHLHDFLV